MTCNSLLQTRRMVARQKKLGKLYVHVSTSSSMMHIVVHFCWGEACAVYCAPSAQTALMDPQLPGSRPNLLLSHLRIRQRRNSKLFLYFFLSYRRGLRKNPFWVFDATLVLGVVKDGRASGLHFSHWASIILDPLPC